MSNTGRVAVVTGAGQGIGKACALGLLRAGWHTVFIGRRAALLEAAIVEAGEVRSEALALSCDVSDAVAVEETFEKIVAAFGRIDLLFNNAGMSGPRGTLDEIAVGEWEKTVATNINGAFLCARAAFGIMKRQTPRGGRIINNGSIAAYSPRPHTAPYAVTKHAIGGLTKCISLDGRPFDIACGQIDIGNVRTEMALPMLQGCLQANGDVKPEPVFELQHVVDALLYMANLPPEANVQTMTVMATKMPYIGRG